MPQAFIDLHSHIAWDVDDGIKTKEDAIKALEQAIEDGIMGFVQHPMLFAEKQIRMLFKTSYYDNRN